MEEEVDFTEYFTDEQWELMQIFYSREEIRKCFVAQLVRFLQIRLDNYGHQIAEGKTMKERQL